MSDADFGTPVDLSVFKKDLQERLDQTQRSLEKKQALLNTFLALKAKNDEILRRLKVSQHELAELMLTIVPACNLTFADKYSQLILSELDQADPQTKTP